MSQPESAIDATNPPSPKTIMAGLAALIVPGVLAVLMYLQTEQGQALYAVLPIPVIVLVKSITTGLIAFIASSQVADPQRILDLAISPKVLAVTLVSILVTALTDVGAWILSDDGRSLYADWSPILVVVLMAIIPAVSTFLAGFIVKDPARLTSKNPRPVATLPPADAVQATPPPAVPVENPPLFD